MKLLSSFHLATCFYSNDVSIGFFVSVTRGHELGLWLNQDPI